MRQNIRRTLALGKTETKHNKGWDKGGATYMCAPTLGRERGYPMPSLPPSLCQSPLNLITHKDHDLATFRT